MSAESDETRFGEYRIVRAIGRGGMGAVYEATHVQIGGRLALKLLRAELAQSPVAAARFLNEARATRRIQHPGVIQIHDFGQTPAGVLYLVMEYLDGESLRRRLQRVGPMGLLALRFGRQLATAMAAAHRCQVIHRDLKPDNIMLVADEEIVGRERVKILDFGIAKLRPRTPDEDGVTYTAPLDVLGTPAYMAPELCRGASEATSQSDVYALGTVLYELIVGEQPFTGRNVNEILYKQLTCQPPPLRQAAAGMPEEVGALIGRMLAKAPEERPTMAAVALGLEQLEAAHGPTGGTAAPASTLGRVMGQLQPAPAAGVDGAPRRPWAGVLIGAGLLALAMLGGDHMPAVGLSSPAAAAPDRAPPDPAPSVPAPPPLAPPPLAPPPPPSPEQARPLSPPAAVRPRPGTDTRPRVHRSERPADAVAHPIRTPTPRRLTNDQVPIYDVPDPAGERAPARPR